VLREQLVEQKGVDQNKKREANEKSRCRSVCNAEAFGLPLDVEAERGVGEETVSGFPGVKKEVDQEIDFKKAEKTVTSTVWLSDRLNLPLRVKTPDGQVFEPRNIVLRQTKNLPAFLSEKAGGFFIFSHSAAIPNFFR
jgi:hypothetical protein